MLKCPTMLCVEKDELQSYIENVGKQFDFDDVVNVYVPRVDEPTHIEHLVN